MVEVDFNVLVHGSEREKFYNYLHSLGYKDTDYSKKEIIESSYPIAIIKSLKLISLTKGATICYMLQKAGKMKTVDEIKESL